ncbi:MAG TPA: ATP-binding protein [Thermoanaerobaculia bacterium]|nr:ATP-binding protein [Thermoanaerobaculia bacterium]
MRTSEQSFAREIGALEAVFDFLHRFFERAGIDPEVGLSLDFVTEELFTNFVRHNDATRAEITIRLREDPETVSIQLIDPDAEPFDPTAVADPKVDRPIDERRAGGLGIHLSRRMLDELVYDYDDRVMTVTATKRILS